MSEHVEELFSAAYDGELNADARAAFDRHLAGCPDCAAAFARLTTAVDALRELGPARMPRPVRLPEGSPLPAPRFGRLPFRPAWGRGLVAGLAAVGTVAVVGGIAAVVLTRGAGTSFSSSTANAPLSGAAGAGGSNARAVPGVAPGASIAGPEDLWPAGCSAQYLGIDATAAAQTPAGFTNRASSDDGVTDVMIATAGTSFAPGETTDVYTRIVDDSSGADYLPCTALEGPLAGSSATVTVPAAEPSFTPGPGPGPAYLTPDGQPTVEVTIPASAVEGATYEVVVEVPAGAGEAQAREVSLQIQIS